MDAEELKYRRLSDAACKELLGDKLILACILKGCVPEFKDCHVNDIENKYIEGEPEIGTIGVHPETTNTNNPDTGGKIHGINAESATDTEGKITFDIRFYALTPANTHMKMIINIEAQNEFYPGYPLMMRAVYYGCRQISAQYGSEFDHSHYEKIKKVYSIWICFDPPVQRRNTITMYHISEKPILGNVEENPEHYDLMNIVMICLGNSKYVRYAGLQKLLDVFISENANLDGKTAVLKSEFGAEMPARLAEKEVQMCNYSDFIMNKGLRQGRQEGMKQGQLMALINLMRNFKLNIDQALQGLSIPEDEWDEYRALVKEMESKKMQ